MKLRIAVWSSMGALVVVLWTVYIAATSPAPLGVVWNLVYLTCPISLARHHSLSFDLVLLTNVVTYATIGTGRGSHTAAPPTTRLIAN